MSMVHTVLSGAILSETGAAEGCACVSIIPRSQVVSSRAGFEGDRRVLFLRNENGRAARVADSLAEHVVCDHV